MKQYPYFITDGALIVLALLFAILAAISGAIFDYAAAFVAFSLVGLRFVSGERSVKAFRESVSSIKGLKAWETEFLSFGTLKFDYNGETAFYSFQIGRTSDGAMPVAYRLCFTNRAKIDFGASRNADPGLVVSGDRSFFALVKNNIERFDKKYEIKRVSNSDGTLLLEVLLEFGETPISEEKKSADMCEFLEEYLEFGFALNKKLKTAAAGRI